MIDPFGKMNANLELEMVWVLVSPKNVIILRLNMVCEGMLCESVWLYWGCFVLFIVVWCIKGKVSWELLSQGFVIGKSQGISGVKTREYNHQRVRF